MTRCTNPHAADTDDDGVNDGTEVAQGSDPLDPSDDGVPDGRTVISFHFGDPSDSHSEKYRLSVTPVSGPGDRPVAHSWSDTWYGVCETKSASLKNGWKYEVRLDHVSTDPHYDGMPNPDYDYELSLPSRPSNVVLVDPQGLFGVDGSSERFGGEGKVACVYALGEPTVLAPKAMGVNNLRSIRSNANNGM